MVGKGDAFYSGMILTVTYNPKDLQSIAHACDRVITHAKIDLGWPTIKNSLLDLVADNLPDVPLETLKIALVVAGYSYGK